MNEFIVIIPSRLSSTRLKEKALLDLNGKSLIERVYLRAIQSNAKEVYIATDSKKIEDHVKNFSPNVILTSKEHESGTDRVHECAAKLDISDDMVIVNVQGDEPFIDPETINKTADIIFENKEVKNGLFFPDGLVISDCEDIFSKDYICKSLTNIRKGSFSIDGDYGEFKLRNTGRYPSGEEIFWDKIEPNMQIQRGTSVFSIIDGDQMAVFHDKTSRPVYFEKFDLQELTDAYMII